LLSFQLCTSLPFFILFLFSFIFLPQPVEEADENVSPFPSFWQKNKENDSLRAHSIIRPQSAQPHSFLRLLSFSSRGPQHPTRHRWRIYIRLHTRPMRTIFDLSTAPVLLLLLLLLKSADDAVI
jgi:hypothetical protein